MSALELGLLIAFGIISIINMIFNMFCLVKLLAFEKSTHQVQYIPMDPEFEKESKVQVEDINKKFKEYIEDDFADIINEQSF